MEVLTAIKTRRSIRKYLKDDISDEQINILLEAAMYAPSAGNAQPWHFIVIRDRETMNKIPTFHPYAKMLYEAPAAILVCGDLSSEKYPGRWVMDCSAATQNILLAAHTIGLGTVWIGIYPSEERMLPIIELFRIPANIIPVSLIAVGYPNENKEVPNRFKPERIHFEKF